MANPKKIMIEQTHNELKSICSKFQNGSEATDIKVKKYAAY